MDVNRQAWTASTQPAGAPGRALRGPAHRAHSSSSASEPLAGRHHRDRPGRQGRRRARRQGRAPRGWTGRDKGDAGRKRRPASSPAPCSSAAEPVRCTFETPEGGTYRITATVDGRPGPAATGREITRWVSGGERPAASEVEQEEVTLIPDRKDYQPGDTAEILVQAPFYPAEGLLTLRRVGLVAQRALHAWTGRPTRCASRSRKATSRTCTCRWTWWARRPRLNDAGRAAMPDAAQAAGVRHRRAEPDRAAAGAHADAGGRPRATPSWSRAARRRWM